MEKLSLYELIGNLRANEQFRYLNKQRVIDFAVENFSRLVVGWEVYKICEILKETFNPTYTEDELMHMAIQDYFEAKDSKKSRN
jgi:hypothetical protein